MLPITHSETLSACFIDGVQVVRSTETLLISGQVMSKTIKELVQNQLYVFKSLCIQHVVEGPLKGKDKHPPLHVNLQPVALVKD